MLRVVCHSFTRVTLAEATTSVLGNERGSDRKRLRLDASSAVVPVSAHTGAKLV